MLKVAVCDDESTTCDYLSRLVLRCAPQCTVDRFLTAEALLNACPAYDITLLDIQMEALDGIAAAHLLRQKSADTILIFITGLRQHVFQAFDVGAFHYLLKPVNEEKFCQVFSRAMAECAAHRPHRRLFINSRNLHRTLELSEIQYVESVRRKVLICTKEEQIEIYATMDELGAQLGPGFYRCHRGYFVNLAEISGYDGAAIRLKSGLEILLSKQKYSGFVRAYMHFLREEEA